jgi:ribonuclease HIII
VIKVMSEKLIRDLDRLLRQISHPNQGSTPDLPSPDAEVFNEICDLVLEPTEYETLWDEHVLLQLSALFDHRPPEATTFGLHVSRIKERSRLVKRINDLLYAVLDTDASSDKVFQTLKPLSDATEETLARLESSDRLKLVREADCSPSQKLEAAIQFLREDLHVRFIDDRAIDYCIEAVRQREGIGVASALFVGPGAKGCVIPVQAQVQPGSGQVHTVVHSGDDFQKSVERARLAMLALGFLTDSQNVVATLDLTEPIYTGPSVALSAAAAIYASARQMIIDPFTTFTGDINLDRGKWRVQPVGGLQEKLEAAKQSGYRRIFVPRAGSEGVSPSQYPDLRLIAVNDLIEVFLHLEARFRPLPGTSPQVKKINALRSFAEARGWELSAAQPIQDAVQFSLLPLHLPELKINIYDTGSHTPKQHELPEYQELLGELAAAGESRTQVRKVEQKLNVADAALRARIRDGFERLEPVERKQEPYCDYSIRLERGPEHLVVKQYAKGTLQIQGTAGDLYREVLEVIVPHYNLHYPKANLSVDTLLQTGPTAPSPSGSQARLPDNAVPRVSELSLPYIGTDESGKGDYFGPLVVAGVIADAATARQLEKIGAKDSKLLSDKRCRELAASIREMCKGKYHEVEIPPDRYNELYEQFRNEKKNLNHLLAWGHARAIESLLERFACSQAVADQFGDEHYILSRLMEKGRQLRLVQIPKAEQFVAVAAASILSRDRFLARLEKMRADYGLDIPKGASDAVVTAGKLLVQMKGASELGRVAKLHHRTTEKILKG